MKVAAARLAALLSTLVWCHDAVAGALAFTGQAFNETGSLIYTEHHRLSGTCTDGRWRPEHQEVRYYWPDAEAPFATKTLHYQADLIRPQVDFVLSEFDTSLMIRQATSGPTLDIRWAVGGQGVERFTVPSSPDLVIDAGFDQLIRLKWASLNQGESVNFRFLAPTRGSDLGFRLDPVDGGQQDYPLVVTARPSNLIARFLVDPITLGYDHSGLLRSYSGLTNIPRNRDGDHFTAKILYTPEILPPCPLIP